MFEATLNTFSSSGTARRKLAVMPIALVVHALVIGGAAISQLWAVSDVPEPVIPIAMVVTMPPPPPPPPPPPQPPETAKPPVTVPDTTAVQPPGIPDTIPTPGPSAGGATGGVPGGIPGGQAGGVPGGIPGGVDTGHTSTEVPAAASDEVPIVIGGEVMPPVILRRVEPQYPEVARHAGLQGVVIAEAIIDKAGNVVDVRILRPLGLGCSEAALEAIKSWKYRPAMLNTRAVAVYLTVTVNFRLSR